MIVEGFPEITATDVVRLEDRCYPDVSDILVLRYRDNPPAYAIKARFEGISELIRELGSPHAVNRIYCVRFSRVDELLTTPDLHTRFKNYSVERFGLNIGIFASVNKLKPLIRDSAGFISQPSYWHERPNYLIQVWRTRVYASPISNIRTSLDKPLGVPNPFEMYLEERWHPTRGKDRYLHWLEHRHRNNSKVDQFRRDALLILQGARKRGRPLGTKAYNTREQFLLDYVEAYSTVARRTMGKPTQYLVVLEMEISVSALQRFLKEFDVPWPPESS